MNKNTLIAAISEDLIVDLTTKLVAIPTPNPPGQEKPLAEFLMTTFRAWDVEAELVPYPDPERPQVVT